MIAIPEHFSRLCSPERQALVAPFGAEVGGRNFLVACDGSGLVAIETESSEGPSAADGVNKYVREMISQDAPGEPTVTSVEAVVALVGPPIWEFPCLPCKGSGKVTGPVDCPECAGDGVVDCSCMDCGNSHEKDCQRCDGATTIDPPDGAPDHECLDCFGVGASPDFGTCPSAVEIAGAVVDPRRLARLLSVVSGPCQVFWKSERVHIRGADWYLELMSVRDVTVDAHFTVPK